jgi:hypothetical protein
MNQRHTDAIEEIDKIISNGGPPGYQIYKIVHILRAMEEKIQEDLENMHQELHIGDIVELQKLPPENKIFNNGVRGKIVDQFFSETHGMQFAVFIVFSDFSLKGWFHAPQLKKICPVLVQGQPQYDENF